MVTLDAHKDHTNDTTASSVVCRHTRQSLYLSIHLSLFWVVLTVEKGGGGVRLTAAVPNNCLSVIKSYMISCGTIEAQ